MADQLGSYAMMFLLDTVYGMTTKLVYKNKRPHTTERLEEMVKSAPRLFRVQPYDRLLGFATYDGRVTLLLPQAVSDET